jgi:hypothetical protein
MEQISFSDSDYQLGHEFTNFPKMWEPPESSRHNKVDMRQIINCRLTNIKHQSINLVARATGGRDKFTPDLSKQFSNLCSARLFSNVSTRLHQVILSKAT